MRAKRGKMAISACPAVLAATLHSLPPAKENRAAAPQLSY
jgi:hypothetical protein